MADEEKNDKSQEETVEEKAPEAEAEEKAPEAEAEETAPEAEAEAPAEDAPAEGEDEASKEPKADAPQTGTRGAEGEDVPADEGDEGMDWKARRRLEASREPAEAHPQQSPEDRAAERAQKRATAVKSRSSYRRKRREGHQPREGTPPAERRSAGRKVRQGRVVSNKSEKTITVRIDAARRHPAYEKIIRHSNTLRAHDEGNEAGEGDLVRVVETRPLSRTKRWRLVEVLEKAK